MEDNLKKENDKLAQWERKLLDLSLRNSLINMKFSKRMIPIWTLSPHLLEDLLADGRDLIVKCRPSAWDEREEELDVQAWNAPQELAEEIEKDFNKGILRCPYGEGELDAALNFLYRTAKTNLQENGANTLYLSLGALKWYEEEGSDKERYAPILLLPVDVVLKSAKQGYVLRQREEEIQANVTLLEKLKQDFQIVLGEIDPLPEDEHGTDLYAVFDYVRQAIEGQKNWEVMETVSLGIFSFSQFAMWNDIRNNSQDLSRNKIVKSLMNGRLAWEAEAMEMGDVVEQGDILLPIAADASQLFAIKEAREGKSFVLHGPPGTGKSQTITALIANSMAQGKTVLFVAEKMAALEVVQKRLAAIGLDAFCMELHSNKARKRTVLNQLQKAIEVKKNDVEGLYAEKAKQIAKVRKKLDAYAQELHAPRNCGWNVYELINFYEECKNAEDIGSFEQGMVGALTKEAIYENDLLIERLVAAGEETGHPKDHPLSRVGLTEFSQTLRDQLTGKWKSYGNSLKALYQSGQEFVNLLSQNNIAGSSQVSQWLAKDYVAMTQYAKDIAFWSTMPKSWANATDLETYLHHLQMMIRHFQKAQELRSQLALQWKEEFFQQDARALTAEYEAYEKEWFLPKLLSGGRFMKKINAFHKVTIAKEELPAQLSLFRQYQNEKEEGEKLFQDYGVGLSPDSNPENVDWNGLQSKILEAGKNQASPALRMASASQPELLLKAQAYEGAFDQMRKEKDDFYSLLQLKNAQDQQAWIPQEKEMLQAIQENSGQLREWISWNDQAEKARERGLSLILTAYENGMDHKDIYDAYRKALMRSLIVNEIDQSSVLGKFSGNIFQKQIEQLKAMDEEEKDLAQKEIFYRLASNVPNFTTEAAKSSEVAILQRAIRSGGRGISIRSLFHQIPSLLPRLCPCMLMSPISVAQYLESNRESFDLVVFDEASQMQTCKAIGALARAKDAVIVGDPKQMPPTNFFMNNNLDEENLDIEDLESILDDCLAINMPQTYLMWHYRSRHESLIAFSNYQFYENKLYTFPSINDQESRVNMVKVEGCFDRGKARHNMVEAQALVDEIKRRCYDPEESLLSYGVVTFNINQQNLIEDLLLKACKEDTQLELWLNREEEPLFVKNLENVQGDERDVILFSVGFGPDQDGKIAMNFGPLNRDGGWRRLNVAVTRARMEMKVFSSLSHDDIDLGRSSSEGVAALKAFLKYAQDHTIDMVRKESSMDMMAQSAPEAIAASILAYLDKNGYQCQQNVGDSDFHIDLAVSDPDHPETYLLGILLDGPQYGKAKTTRDRELAQISVLQGLGWEIHRIWTMDWWENADKECRKLLQTIMDCHYQKKAMAERKQELEEYLGTN